MAVADKITGFKVKFNIVDYFDILPPVPHDLSEIINFDKPEAECIWQQQDLGDEPTDEIKEREVKRFLKTGVWIYIKKQLIWLPPNYYGFLQYGTAGGTAPEFRLKRLKQIYFKIRVRNSQKALGTYTVKNRQDGETTMAIWDALWECADGNMNIGQIGIQSKTNEDAKNPCWLTLQILWGGLPIWVKDLLYSDFASEGTMEVKMKFQRSKTEGKEARNILLAYYPSVHNAMDGKNNMRRCILDEVNKWHNCSFYDTFINYEKFIAVGSSRRGLFDIFSSPADTDGKWNDEAKVFWYNSNPEELTLLGSTKTRVFRYHSDPLEGIEGYYDIYGDADADDIYLYIMEKRKSLPEDKVMGEVRAFPLNEAEMFGSFDAANLTWANSEGIIERMAFLRNAKYKDPNTKEPILIYGNLQWKDNIPDNPQGVEFRQSDLDHFDLEKARFCFSHIPKHATKLTWQWSSLHNSMRPLPPQLTENIIGIDPVDKRYGQQGKKGISNGSMTNTKYLDLDNTGIVGVPTAYYCCRPQHVNTFFEDAIKFAVYMQCFVQVENKNTKIVDWFEDRGYMDFLLSKRGEPQNSKNKGDAPGRGGAFLNEMIAMIDEVTNVPISKEAHYKLDDIWFYDLLEDIMKLDPSDTQKSDGFNSWGQSLIGKTKVMQIKPRKTNVKFTTAFLNHVLN